MSRNIDTIASHEDLRIKIYYHFAGRYPTDGWHPMPSNMLGKKVRLSNGLSLELQNKAEGITGHGYYQSGDLLILSVGRHMICASTTGSHPYVGGRKGKLVIRYDTGVIETLNWVSFNPAGVIASDGKYIKAMKKDNLFIKSFGGQGVTPFNQLKTLDKKDAISIRGVSLSNSPAHYVFFGWSKNSYSELSNKMISGRVSFEADIATVVNHQNFGGDRIDWVQQLSPGAGYFNISILSKAYMKLHSLGIIKSENDNTYYISISGYSTDSNHTYCTAGNLIVKGKTWYTDGTHIYGQGGETYAI